MGSVTSEKDGLRRSHRTTQGQRPLRFLEEPSSFQVMGRAENENVDPEGKQSSKSGGQSKASCSIMGGVSKSNSTARHLKEIQLAKLKRHEELMDLEIERKRLTNEAAALEDELQLDSDDDTEPEDLEKSRYDAAERTKSWTNDVRITRSECEAGDKDAAILNIPFQLEADAFEKTSNKDWGLIEAQKDQHRPDASKDSSSKEPSQPTALPTQKQTRLTPMEKFVARQSAEKDLPIFSGNPEEWPRFLKRFKQSTVSCQFSDTENIARLEKCLRGNAKETVQSILALSDDVHEVMEILEMNFGRADLIIGTLIDKARKTPSVREDRQETIVEFGNSIRSLVANIVALESPGHLYNSQLLKEMEDKLPGGMKTQWGAVKCCKKGQVTLKDFADFIKVLAMNASYVSQPKLTVPEPVKSQFGQQQFRGNRRDSVMNVDSNRREKMPEKKCSFCTKNGHSISSCNGYQNLNSKEKWRCISDLKLCFTCLKPGHRLQQCKNQRLCEQDGCNKPHHPSLHPTSVMKEENRKEPVGNVRTCNEPEQVFLRILPVTLVGPYGEFSTYAFLDPGATCTLIQASMASKLGLQGPIKALQMEFADATCSLDSQSQRVNLQIIATGGSQSFALENVKTARKLNLPYQAVNGEALAKKWKHLRNAPQYCSYSKIQPTILIGEDNHQLIKVEESFEGPEDSPSLSRCRLGYFIHGSKTKDHPKSAVYVINIQECTDSLQHLMQESFKIDALGMEVKERHLLSRDDERSMALLDSTTKRVGERWETGLLWRKDEIELPESKTMAIRRLKSLETKLDRNEEYAREYCQKIDDYLKKGYARVLSMDEVRNENKKAWFLPHFGTTNPNKPGKMRLVFDAAASSRGLSLNENLMKGPDMLQSLIGVLVNFRQFRIAFGGDIKEMFHQVNIRSEDLPAQRFLWRGMERNKEPDVLELSVMTFGSTSSPCSAQYVKNRNAKEFETEFPEAALAITKRHYVDDYFDSKNTEKEAINLIRDVIEIHRRGGFEIRNWISNSTAVMTQIPEHLRGYGVVNLTGNVDTAIERILGVNWDAKEDSFTFTLRFNKVDQDIINQLRIPTKREVLGLVMSIYDPLGFIGHYTVKGKILLKNIWASEIGWDDQLKPKQEEQWNIWIKELKLIEQVKILRCYSVLIPRADSIQLHVFCDASEEAFCTVAYIRVKSGKTVETNLVMSKTRVSPKKSTTIPRLELQAALLGTRLSTLIHLELDTFIPQTHYWSDSMTVLHWLRSDTRQFKQFVANRVGEIEETTNVADWHYVPTKENVADEGTRSVKGTEFKPNSRWFNGPSFLLLDEEHWPKESKSSTGYGIINEEELERKEYVNLILPSPKVLPDVSRFSSWLKLIRTTAYVTRYVLNCRERANKTSKKTIRDWELSVAELRRAEDMWINQSQRENFPEEVSTLSDGKPIAKSSKLYQLSPFMDQNGVIRIRGRLASADVCFGVKFPAILDPSHSFTKLLIDHHHVRGGHHGQERVVNELRQSYWVLKMRTAVRSAWTRCQSCKNSKSKPVVPEMGDVPASRLESYASPFTITGLDYFGPMEVTVGRRREKRWGALFVCMTTRAVHVEIARRLDTDAAINAIRRFIGIRGRPKEIHSDNGTNFKGADNELQKAMMELNQSEIKQNLSSRGIEWKFIPPSSPHMGGSWERLVRSVKVALAATLKERAPREEVLETLLREATFIVNGRPLTHVAVDPNDPESITPNHFLIGSSGADSVPGVFEDSDIVGRKQWRIAQRLTDHFWKRWTKEYLPTLTRRCKWHKSVVPMKIGDIVVIADYDGPRNEWRMGKVIEIHPGQDGRVRVVSVRTSTGILKRPVAKLCKLDVYKED